MALGSPNRKRTLSLLAGLVVVAVVLGTQVRVEIHPDLDFVSAKMGDSRVEVGSVRSVGIFRWKWVFDPRILVRTEPWTSTSMSLHDFFALGPFDTLEGPILLWKDSDGFWRIPIAGRFHFQERSEFDDQALHALAIDPGNDPGSLVFRLLPGLVDSSDPEAIRFRWLDGSGRLLGEPRQVRFRFAGERQVLPARCGELDCGVELGSRPIEPSISWCVWPGRKDTAKFPGGLSDYSNPWVGKPGWMDGVERVDSLKEWARVDSGAGFERHRIDHTGKSPPDFRVQWESIRWRRHGRVWRVIDYLPSYLFGEPPSPRSHRPVPNLSDRSLLRSRYPRGLYFQTIPSYVQAGRAFWIPGLGRAVWMNMVRWDGPDSLVALANVENVDEDGPSSFKMRSGLVAVPLSRVQVGPDSETVRPRFDQVRILEHAQADIEFDKAAAAARAARDLDAASGADRNPIATPADPAGANRCGRSTLSSDETGFHTASIEGSDPSRTAPVTGVAKILSRDAGIRFAVDNVEANVSRLTPKDSTGARFRTAESDAWTYVRRAFDHGPEIAVPSDGMNGFVQSAILAWSQHRPLRISPEAIWYTLRSHALEWTPPPENEENIIDRILSMRERPATPKLRAFPAAWLSLLDQHRTWDSLSARLVDTVEPARKGTMRFSTTRSGELLVDRLRPLGCMLPELPPLDRPLCGIPWIRLEGTAEDWRKLRREVASSKLFRHGEWNPIVDHVLMNFVQTAEGKPSLDFWRSFLRYHPGGEPWMDGWITLLLPVVSSGEPKPFPADRPLSELLGGTKTCSFTWMTPSGRSRSFLLRSGFTGVSQAKDGALRAELGWEALEDTTWKGE